MANDNSRDQSANSAVRRDRAGWITYFELSAVIIFAVLLASASVGIVRAVWAADAWWIFGAAMILGYLCVDFASGIVHWFGDSFFREDTPILGQILIEPFRDHHRDPQGIARHSFLELNGNNCLGVIPILLFMQWRGGPDTTDTLSIFGYSVLFAFVLFEFMTNQFHRWAHADEVPPGVRWLQRKRLILSPDHHQLHHQGDFSRSYCITAGWMNWLLDPIDFFPRMERGIRTLLRRPKACN